jgi:predicted transcriptional regulator of viral defense system
MYFGELLRIVGREPVFEPGLLLAGDADPKYVRRQLSGWVQSGKLWQLRRGLYAVAPPHQKVSPHPFLVANRLLTGSYVSLQTALAYHHLIPEHVAAVTSVTTRRPGEWETLAGRFTYRHIKADLFFGYERRPVDDDQFAYLATPAKALLDLVYLQPGGDSQDYLESLRLQNLDQLDSDRVLHLAELSGRPKLRRAAHRIVDLVDREAEAYRTL